MALDPSIQKVFQLPAMLIVTPQQALPAALRGGIVAIGNFDGVHRGHQALLARAAALAKAQGKAWGVICFEPHPRSFFRPAQPVFRLTPEPLKLRLLAALGADFVSVVPFNAELSALGAEAFIAQELKQRLGASHVVAGFDFHFGAGRKGNAETLRAAGLSVDVVDEVTDEKAGHIAFSSSNIRNSLRQGQVRQAAFELGYDWMISGTVVPGDQRGRTIGFPTANIIVEPGVEPARGIYATSVREVGKSTPVWIGAGYFGDRPTFNTNRTFLEVYLLDENIDLYGRELTVSFVDLIRPDQSFKSVESLVAQMKLDCEAARRIVGAHQAADFPLAKLQAAGRI